MIKGEIAVKDENKGVRLDIFCHAYFVDYTRAYIKTLIDEGKILVNAKQVKAGFPLKSGMIISYEIPDVQAINTSPEYVDFEILFENSNLLVINKPQGLVVHPCASTKSGTLVNGLLARVGDLSGINGKLRPGIVHRLDKNTSGLMLVAKNDKAHMSLSEQISSKSCVRKYLALLHGNLKQDEGVIDTRFGRNPKDRMKMAVLKEGGRQAITQYRVVERYQKYCLVEFTLKTGRTHQIRVHASYLGHPVVGDDLYGKAEKSLAGQLLHSYYIEFDEPSANERLSFTASLPIYFEDFIKKVR